MFSASYMKMKNQPGKDAFRDFSDGYYPSVLLASTGNDGTHSHSSNPFV